MRTKRFRYQDRGCALTLRQGLQEYFAGHSGLLNLDPADIQTEEFFRSHDACHVLFGLDTTLPDEGLADLWTVFGTDIGLRWYVIYLCTNPAARQIVKDIGLFQRIATGLRLLPSVARVFLRSRKMTNKWPWGHEGRYLDCPLIEIRHEFNIDIL
jgi:hypothetical protein